MPRHPVRLLQGELFSDANAYHYYYAVVTNNWMWDGERLPFCECFLAHGDKAKTMGRVIYGLWKAVLGGE